MKSLIKSLLLLTIAFYLTQSAIRQDIVSRVPGYGDHFQSNVYSGYLNTSDPGRRLHYVFIESEKGANASHPVTLWLNGGPGCSSMLGFLQQIGPFYLEEGINYTDGDQLKQNPYSWHKVSHLLFIESPAGVGYSINENTNFTYNDQTTMEDNFDALKFFFTYYPEYSKNQFWLAGESYAGKYIPDLAYWIDRHNTNPSTKPEQKINMVGMLIGNGVIDFRDGALEKNRIQYLIAHDFVDPNVKPYWENSCTVDEFSAGCQYFLNKFYENTQQINPYNVYSYCYYNDSFTDDGQKKKKFLSQQSILMNLSKKNGKNEKNFNGAPCAYFDGLYQYFTVHAETFHAQKKQWNGPCAEDISINYYISPEGSVNRLQYLLAREMQGFSILLYNGDWDAVVPYVDTIKNFENMNLKQNYLYTPIILDDGQHIGFNQIYSGLNFFLVKGASHQVPQSKREAAFHMFESLVYHDQTFVTTSHGKPKRKIPKEQ